MLTINILENRSNFHRNYLIHYVKLVAQEIFKFYFISIKILVAEFCVFFFQFKYFLFLLFHFVWNEHPLKFLFIISIPFVSFKLANLKEQMKIIKVQRFVKINLIFFSQ